MNGFDGFELREIIYGMTSAKLAEELSSQCGLRFEKLDYCVGLFDGEDLLAMGGYEKNTIKCIAVSPLHRGEGLASPVISRLTNRLLRNGVNNIKVFTKPENKELFRSMGYSLVEESDMAIFSERGHPGIADFVKGLATYIKDGVNGAVVVNCNPFTKGHRALIEYASSHCDNLYVFVVSEDKSVFPFADRFDIVKKGVSDIKNVTVLKGGDYIISASVFPSYFIKEYSDITKTHAELDVKIFGRYISPALDIKKRFAGEEPLDVVTAEYNKAMKKYLPTFGVETCFIKRIETHNAVISAGKVRSLIKSDDFDELANYLPDVTLEYLTSERGKKVIDRIKEN